MRKYSKILGAFSMSLASLLGFCPEACHAQGSPVTAIDILLEPDATMVQHSQADNARLLKAYPDGFALDVDVHDTTAHHHASAVRSHRGPWQGLYAAANRILVNEKVTSWNLRAFKYYYIPVPPNGIAGIVVEPTENLLRLQQALLDAVAPFTERTGTAAAFVSADGRRDIQQGIDRLRRQFHFGRVRQEVQSACHDRCRS